MTDDELNRVLGSLPPGACVVGVDEVGRGPLAGDVVAAAVVLDPDNPVAGLADSKKLSEKRREQLAAQLQEQALVVALGRASVQEIDTLNILQASLLAMWRAVEGLAMEPDLVLVDGKHLPRWSYPSLAVVGGDARVPAIAAASIVAKVTRDREMQALHRRFPQYGFDAHKGYPTATHRRALEEHGACPEHRRSFAPVRAVTKTIRKES
jgi:ribonuclease HII